MAERATHMEIGRRELCRVVCGLGLLALSGCSLFRANPLDQKRGAIVLVFDTRTAGELKSLREMLSAFEARATIFAAGQIQRQMAGVLKDFKAEGHEVGLSGLRGVDPRHYSQMYGNQKYFQDEIVVQVLGAERQGLDLRYYLIGSLVQSKMEVLTLPSFLVGKGFARVVHKMPDKIPPGARPAVDAMGPLINAYELTEKNFKKSQIAALSKLNEILIVMPNRKILPELLREARAQGVPFATLSDLKTK